MPRKRWASVRNIFAAAFESLPRSSGNAARMLAVRSAARTRKSVSSSTAVVMSSSSSSSGCSACGSGVIPGKRAIARFRSSTLIGLCSTASTLITLSSRWRLLMSRKKALTKIIGSSPGPHFARARIATSSPRMPGSRPSMIISFGLPVSSSLSASSPVRTARHCTPVGTRTLSTSRWKPGSSSTMST
ncbi:MAG: hypothetical protein H6Q89_5651 [Myxococcaceae bacterium]|nr:hypothetical protein [Myxococcaceae bacterium]